MKRRSRLVLLAFFLCCLTAALEAEDASAASQDTLKISLFQRVSTLDPWNTAELVAWWVLDALYDCLYTIDAQTLKPVPNLVVSHKLINNTTWEFELKKGVKFSNGEPFNAEAVKFSFDRGLDPERKLYTKPQWDRIIESVQIVDDSKVRIITKKPDPILLNRLASYSFMVPPKYIKEKGDAYFGEHPIGTGPYKLVNWKRGEEIILEANKDYWGNPPNIKKLQFRKIPEAAVSTAELITGGIDVIPRILSDQVPTVEKSAKAKIESKPSSRVFFLQVDADGRAGKTPLQDLKVRRAVYHAIDRKAIMRDVKRGYAEMIHGPLSKIYFGYDPNMEKIEPEYNPEKAKKLLAEAGYANGFDAEISAYDEKQIVEAIQGYLLKIGIKTRLNWYGADLGTLIKLRNAGKVKDLGMYSFGPKVFDADIFLTYWHHSTMAPCAAKRKELDNWLDEASGTFDIKRRQELYSKVQRYIVENVLWVPILSDVCLYGVNKNLNFAAIGEFPQFHKCSWK